ncbi:lysophospholipid acyltransferase family protein [Rubrivirga sp. IMCC45206]|uniref:lysophospholipid acyltransferase family protein n=1 Tax=Rubrivirga sp. IMCC45206 TaxID=3391614 RepID=UPI00398F99D9
MTATLPRTTAPSLSLAHRLWFGWVVVWAAFFTLTMSPLLVLHSALAPTARTLRAWMHPWARFIMGLSGFRVETVYRAPLPDGPVVFASNHINSLDIPAAMVGLPRPFLYMARHELRAWPLVGWVLEKTACLFIRRDNPRQAVLDLQHAAERIRGGDSVLIYPEGGRSHSHALEPFMSGPFVLAIRAGVPVVPVTLIGQTGVLSQTDKTAWPGTTRCVVGAPIPTAGLRRGDAAELSARVRAAIETELAEVEA